MNNKRKANKLIRMALYCIAQTKPFEDITIAEICKKANVSRMSFYRSYNTKEDVFVDYCDEQFDLFFEKIKGKPNISYDELLLIFFQEIKNKSRQIKLLEKTNKLNLLSILFESYASYIFQTHFQLDTNKLESKYISPFISGGIANLVIRWCKRDFIDSPEDMANCIKNILN